MVLQLIKLKDNNIRIRGKAKLGVYCFVTKVTFSNKTKALFVKLRKNGLNETFEKRAASIMQQIVVETKDK